MKKLNKYKIIFFDWNNTLSNSLFWEQLKDVNHPRYSWYNLINKFLFLENKKLIEKWMVGKISHEDVSSKVANYIIIHLKEKGQKHSVDSKLKKEITKIIDSDLEESCRKMRFVSEEITELLEKLRRMGKKCVIATDNMDTFIKYTKPSMELEKYFDDFLVSSELNTFKFDIIESPEGCLPFFDRYLKAQKVKYDEVVLIDDCVDNTGTFKSLGFETFQVKNTKHFINVLQSALS